MELILDTSEASLILDDGEEHSVFTHYNKAHVGSWLQTYVDNENNISVTLMNTEEFIKCLHTDVDGKFWHLVKMTPSTTLFLQTEHEDLYNQLIQSINSDGED